MIKPLLRIYLFLPVVGVALGCSGGGQHENKATEALNIEDKMRYEQYMVQGELLYKTHCANCHREDGTGFRRLIPPLANADYMMQDVNRTLCIIKHGMQGEILVNGTDYNQKMPGNEQLKDIEIAQIATFIYNSWGNQHGYISAKEVTAKLNHCP